MKKGFTLLEMTITIVVMSALLTGLIFVINSTDRFKKQRDNQRRLDIEKIASVIIQYRSLEGSYPTGLTTTYQDICKSDFVSSTNCLDLSLLEPDYLKGIPEDPKNTDANNTGYRIRLVEDKVWLDVVSPEVEDTIEITR